MSASAETIATVTGATGSNPETHTESSRRRLFDDAHVQRIDHQDLCIVVFLRDQTMTGAAPASNRDLHEVIDQVHVQPRHRRVLRNAVVPALNVSGAGVTVTVGSDETSVT